MVSFHTLAEGDELEVWIPGVDQYVEVRVSKNGVPEIYCTPQAAVFRRHAAVFQQRAKDVERYGFGSLPPRHGGPKKPS